MATETAGITDEAIARLRARIGVAEPHPQPPHYRRPDVDAFRHVANAYGDDNPLWCDPDYARRHPCGTGPIAPPPLVGGDTLIGEDEVTEVADEHRDAHEGRPAARRARLLLAPAPASGGRRCAPATGSFRRNALVGVLDKPSEFAERAVHEWTGQVFRDDDGTAAVGPVPADDPHRARRRRASARSTTPSSSAATTDERHRRDRRAVRRARARAAPSPAGGRTSTRATRSARW